VSQRRALHTRTGIFSYKYSFDVAKIQKNFVEMAKISVFLME
jgi:hypothetical protein